MAAIKETFFQECEEQLAELETGLLAMAEASIDPETVNAVFRAVHSIKGGAGAFKFTKLVQFAHAFETTLDEVRAGRLVLSPEALKTMLRAADVLADLVRSARDGVLIDPSRTTSLIEELAAVGASSATGSEDGPTANDDGMGDLNFEPIALSIDIPDVVADRSEGSAQRNLVIRFTPHSGMYAKANETALLLRELGRLGEKRVTCDTGRVPPLSDLDPEGAYLKWIVELRTTHDDATILGVFEFVIGDCDIEISPALPADDAPDTALLPSSGTELAPGVEAQPISGAPAEQSDRETGNVQAQRNHALPERLTPDAAKPTLAKVETAAGGGASQPTIRVDLERVDRLINLVGELVINQSMLSQRVIEAGLARASGVTVGLEELQQLTREIQESVMAIRAQPVKSLFQRMSRIAREVADATGKSVRLKTCGEATEVDKTVIERLADPLTHMIRNAVDHGLETPEARLRAGKPAEGIVHLSAAHRSGRVIIEVSDDGAGINRSKVKASAASKGLIADDTQLSENEIDNLIFLPGFSTVETVSNISGRGVGMDVVKRSIHALGGRVAIASRPGQGSTFTMSLPLTLAVLDGMVVRVDDETLVVPLTAIVGTLKPKQADVHAIGADARVLAIRGSFVPLIDVGRELGYRSEHTDAPDGVVLLVETERGARSALIVDSIQDQCQVVIKSLENNYGRVPGIAAATILGDGRIALIIDVDALVAAAAPDLAPPKTRLTAAG
jgi:two-component system chemotaxis sensor kinase CheA